MVAHCKVTFSQRVSALRAELHNNLIERQVEVQDSYMDKTYAPHVTLAYYPKTGKWDETKEPPVYIGSVPKGISFNVSHIELWHGSDRTKFSL